MSSFDYFFVILYFISYFIRYMYFMKMFVIKRIIKKIYIKNIVSKCPEHSLTDLDMHTPLHYVQETKKEIDTY